MTIAIEDSSGAVTNATAELTDGHLILSAPGSSAAHVDLDLTNPRYDTIGGLYQTLSRARGFTAQMDKDANTLHPSIDIEPFPPLSIVSTGVELTHHVWSDQELYELLKGAVQRHNPSFDPESCPPQEFQFVLPLAQAMICRASAYDASKRRGLDKDVSSLIALADSFERQYADDVKRLSRAIQSPKEANPNTMDEGDVVQGTMYRRSLRTGFMSPLAASKAPSPIVLLDPDDQDIEDNNVRVVWERNKDQDFQEYELWMDTRPEVARSHEGSLVMAGQPTAYLTSEATLHHGATRRTTSQMVFRSFGANSNSSRSSFATFVEEFGQLIRSFAVPRLESDTDYYFRLYVVNLNYGVGSSNVVHARTKALRARFISVYGDPENPAVPSGTPLSVTSGPSGTVVNVTLDSTKGAYTTEHRFLFGGKTVTPVIVDPFHLTVTVPSFQNLGPKDVTIISPTQLISVIHQGFTVTAT